MIADINLCLIPLFIQLFYYLNGDICCRVSAAETLLLLYWFIRTAARSITPHPHWLL